MAVTVPKEWALKEFGIDEPEPGVGVGDVAKSLAGAATTAVGATAQGLGIGADTVMNAAVERVLGKPSNLRVFGKDPLADVTKSLRESRSAGAELAQRDSMPTGDIVDPSTWSFGKAPSLGGYVLNAADVVGQFAPQAAAAVAMKRMPGATQMTVGAGLGAAQGAGGAAGEEGARVRAATHEQLMGSSAEYASLVQGGAPIDEARETVARLAESGAAAGAAGPAGAGGLVEQAFLGGRFKIPALGGGPVTRAATAAIGAGAAEGLQEVVEGVGQRLGSNIAIGGDASLTEDSFPNFVLGALGGGAFGGGVKLAETLRENPMTAAAAVAQASGASAPGPATAAAQAGSEAPRQPVDADRPFFAFTETGANKRAELLSRQGTPSKVVPHPEREGRFAVMPDEYGTAQDDAGRKQALENERRALTDRMPKGRPAPASVVERVGRIDAELESMREDAEAAAVDKEKADAKKKDADAAAEKKALETAAMERRAQQQQKAGDQPATASPTAAETAAQTDAQANEAATSPQNERPEPSAAQVEAGNYAKGHVKVGGLDISVENPEGSIRRSKPGAKVAWERKMQAHYGYIKGVPARAPDKEHVDVFVKTGTPETHSGPVFVIDQNTASGKFDEPKTVVGAANEAEARQIYLSNYSKGQEKRIRGITALPWEEFKAKLNDPKAFLEPQQATLMPAAAPESAVPMAAAETGKPFAAQLMRGEGRVDSPYNKLGAQEPILGAGLYTTPDRKYAESFGPNVTTHDVALTNPLVVKNDAQWRALTRKAGWEFPNPFGQDPEKTKAAIVDLRAMIEKAGHDGVIVNVPQSEADGKTLQKVFGESQVVKFSKPAATTPKETADDESKQLPVPDAAPAKPGQKEGPGAQAEEAVAPEGEVGTAERWWDKDLTKEGRKQVYTAARLAPRDSKLLSAPNWANLHDDGRVKVAAIRGTAEDPVVKEPSKPVGSLSGLSNIELDKMATQGNRSEQELAANERGRRRGEPEPSAAAPEVIWKKAKIIPTREGVKAVEIPEAEQSDEERAKADLAAALADLGDLLGKNGRLNITPEQEQKLLPVLTRLFDAAFRLGHIKFKQAARFVRGKIEEALGKEVADELTLEHYQGGYIATSGRYRDKGAETAKEVAAVDSLDEEAAPTEAVVPRFGSGAVETLSTAEMELRDLSQNRQELLTDVLLGNRKYVAFKHVVRLAREGIESGAIRPMPAQINFKLDVAMRDVHRVLAAAQKPNLMEKTPPGGWTEADKVPAKVQNLEVSPAEDNSAAVKALFSGRDGKLPDQPAVDVQDLDGMKGWDRIGYINGRNGVGYGVDHRDIVSTDGGVDVATRQIRIYDSNRASSMGAWEWESRKSEAPILAGLRIDKAIFHYVFSSNTEDAFGEAGSSGDALWNEYGDEIKSMLSEWRGKPDSQKRLSAPQQEPDESVSKAAALKPAEGVYTDSEAQDDPLVQPGSPDRTGAKALEGVPSEEGARPDGEREAGDGTRGSRGSDADGYERVQGGWAQRPRIVAGEPGTAPSAEGGTAGTGSRRPDAGQPGVGRDGRGRSDVPARPRGGLAHGEPFPVAGNFVITDELGLGKGGQVQKYNDNVAAIRLLKAIESEGRQATPAEQQALARYVGWGGIKQAFPRPGAEPVKGWAQRVAEIRELLTPEEHEAAARSIQDAHYTSEDVVDGMWNIARRLGFDGGKVLETSMGVGNFFGLMPADLRSGASLTGIELDSITARIAKQLYPKANVLGPIGFHEVTLADANFNLNIGNPPFGNQSLYDPTAKHLNGFSIHNFFFAKSIDKLAPGGLHIQVVSRYFMDAQNSPARKYIAHRAELVGAIRLPWTAFSENANTEVVTDIVILKKLPESQWGTATASWTETAEIPDPLGNAPMPVNTYFVAHPEMILGQMDRSGEMQFENDITVQPREGQTIAEGLADAMHNLPENIYERGKSAEQVNAEQVAAVVPEDVIENYSVGQYFEDGGKMLQRVMTSDGSLQAVEITADTKWSEKSTWGESRIERLRGMVGIRQMTRDLLKAEATDEPDARIKKLRGYLNKRYDAFVAKHGYLNQTANDRVFKADPDAPLLLALEDQFDGGVTKPRANALGIPARKAEAKKMPIFTQRVVRPHTKIDKADTPEDGLALSISEKGAVSIPYIARLTGKPEEDVIEALTKGDKPQIYLDPAKQTYELASDYLSGNVKRKYREALGASLYPQAEKLKSVFPEDVKAGDLKARLGAPWIDRDAYEGFVSHLLGEDVSSAIQYLKATGGFAVRIEGGDPVMLNTRWGTSRRDAADLINRILNSRDMTILHPEDAEGRRAVNVEDTQAALDKADEIRLEFEDWVFKDASQRERLVAFYNDHFNTNISTDIDGTYLTLPGKVPDAVIKLRRHQLNAVARIIRRGKVLLDHVVGAGKTFTIVAGVMEKRRLGLAQKPMIVVLNHLVEQWATDFYRLYPGAKVLAMRKSDFTKANRQRMLARVATGDWDAVIFSHSSFAFINSDRAVVIEAIRKQVGEIQNAIDLARETEGKKSRTATQYQKKKEALQERMKKLIDRPRDKLLTFQELGVDDLTVDESQEFKNLFFTTQKQNVGGFGNPSGSQRAFDMFIKTGWLLKNQDGRGVTFATGTPVSNSLTELFTLQRYLGMEELEARGVTSLDAWLGSFGIVQSEYESNVTGTKYKRKERMRRLTNVPEVIQLYKEFSDSVTQDQINQNYREDNNGEEFPIPKVKGYPKSRANIVVPRTDLQSVFSAGLQDRMEKLKRGGEDNALSILGDGRKAALDMRLVDPSAPDHPGSKTHMAADHITRIYKAWDKKMGTQLVFLDISTPLKHGKSQAKNYLKEARELLDDAEAAPYGTYGAQWNRLRILLRERMDFMEEHDQEKGIDAIERFLEQGDDIEAAVNTVDRNFSVYDDLRAKLVDRGIPNGEIAFIHDFNGDTKKQELFDMVNAGRIRVLIGSTAKMGAGTNVQRKLVGLHHMDAPWRPSDIEQREGRIIRQGNEFRLADDKFEVEINAYATEGTSDVFFWQTQEQKLIGINSLRNFKGEREIEEVSMDAMSAAEMKALSSGNPLILEDVQLTEAIRKMEGQRRRQISGQQDIETEVRKYDKAINNMPAIIARQEETLAKVRAYQEDPFEGTRPTADMDGKAMDAAEADRHVKEVIDAAKAVADEKNKPTSLKMAPLADQIRDAMKGATNYKKDLKKDLEAKWTALEETLESPKWEVTFAGKKYTNRDTVQRAIVKELGDVEAIRMVVGGESLIRRKDIDNKVKPMLEVFADANKGSQTLGTIAGMPVDLEWIPARGEIMPAAVAVKVGGEIDYVNQVSVGLNGTEKIPISAAQVVSIVEHMIGGVAYSLGQNKAFLNQAKKGVEPLRAEIGKQWGREDELNKKRERLTFVRNELSGKNAEIKAKAEAGVFVAARHSPASLRAELQSRLGVDPETLGTTIVEQWGDLPQAVIEDVIAAGAYDLQGAYDPDTDRAYLIAGNIPPGNGLAVMLHETGVHRGMRSFVGESAFNDLAATIERWAVAGDGSEEARLAAVAAARIPAETSPEVRREELLAYFVEEAVNAGHDVDSGSAIGNWLRALVRAIGDALRKLGANPGELRAADVVALARGALRQDGAQTGGSRFSIGSTAFKRWFGESKVVDADGEPLVVYHGTDDNFSEFSGAGGVNYFTPDAAYADRFTAGGSIMPVYLSIKNPLDARDLGDGDLTAPRLIQFLRRNNISSAAFERKVNESFKPNGVPPFWQLLRESPGLFDVMRDEGYDGVILKEHIGQHVADAYLTFKDPAQIKSAIGNRGTYDPTNPDIRFSRPGQGARFSRPEAAAANTARQRVMNAVKAMTDPGMLGTDEGVLNAWNKTVGSPELVARKNPAFARVFWEGQAFLNTINRQISESEAMLPAWFKGQDALSRWWDRIRGKQVANAEKSARALLDGTLENRVYSDEELAARGLSQVEIDMYRQARDAIDAILDKTGAALLSKIAPRYANVIERMSAIYRDGGLEAIEDFTGYSKNVGQAAVRRAEQAAAGLPSEASRASLKEAQGRLDEWNMLVGSLRRIRQLQENGYFPLSRFGRHYVNVTDPRGETIEFRMYESDLMARAGAARLQARYPKAYQIVRGTVSQDTPELFKGLTPETVELFAEITGMDQDESMQKYLKEAVANRSVFKRMIHRKGTPGYSKDAVRVLADFMSTNARYYGRLKHADKMTSYASDIKGGELKDYAINLVTYLRGDTGREEYQALRGFLFFQYIGGNISSALLNLTQVPLFGLPWLNQHVSISQAGGLLKRAYPLSMRDPATVFGTLGEALRRAEADGVTNPQNVYTMMAIGAGSKIARVRAFSGLLDAWAYLFSKAETMNRRVMFIAGHELATRRGLTGDAAYEFAIKAVQDTQFIYNKGNRPVWARGIGAIPFTFKIFTIQALETIFAKLPPKQAAMLLALMVLAAGIEGLPFAENMEDVFDAVGQRLGYPTNSKRWLDEQLQAAFRDWLGLPPETAFLASEMVRKGVLAATPAAALGARVGMGRLIPGTEALLSGKSIGSSLMEVVGPVGGFASNLIQAGDLLARGEFGRAAEKALPSGVANAVKGARQFEAGEEVTPAGRRVAEIPKSQAVLQGIGIVPRQSAVARERAGMLKQDEAFLKEVEDRITDKWASGIISNDPDKVREARADLAAHNERNPEARIKVTPRQVSSRVKNMRREGLDRVLRGVAKERRGDARDLLEAGQ